MYYFGIDLGTTNSAIAVHHKGASGTTTKVIPLPDGATTIPSCVSYNDDGSVTVGAEAFKRRYDTQHVVYSAKRDMGTPKVFDLLVSGAPKQVTPIEVSTQILMALKEVARPHYGHVTDVTITVPAYFGMDQRRDTKIAAEQAGFKVLSLISEPTSAALAYGLESELESEQILVYDLGGGTFDVTLLQYNRIGAANFNLLGLDLGQPDATDSGIACRVISTAGDNRLGGDDLDRAVVDRLLEDICQAYYKDTGIEFSPADIPVTIVERLLCEVEFCKRHNVNGSYQYTCNFQTARGDYSTTVYWGGADYARAFTPIFEKTLAGIQQCLMSAPSVTFSKIVLVGGSTKLPLVTAFLQQAYPAAMIYNTLNPDESVAIGAAVKAAVDKGESSTIVDDILPMSIGIESVDYYGDSPVYGSFTPIIPKNAALPAEAAKSFATHVDNQEAIELKIYQGSSLIANMNTLLGVLEFEDIPKGKAGDVEVIVRFIVDTNGLLTIRVKTMQGEKTVQLKNILNPEADLKSPITKKLLKLRHMLTMVDISAEHKDIIEMLIATGISQQEIDQRLQDVFSEVQQQFVLGQDSARTYMFETSALAHESLGDPEDTEEE